LSRQSDCASLLQPAEREVRLSLDSLYYDLRVKILHVETGRHLYGGARQAGYLIAGLADRGIDNLLVCAKGHPLATGDAARVFEWRLGGDLDFSLYRRLVQLARDERPDIVHIHSRRGADSFGGRAARRAGVPAILTRRVQSAEPGVWFRWKSAPYQSVVAISAAVHAELTAWGIANDRLALIPSAVDTSVYRPDSGARSRLISRYALPADALIGGAAAQLIPRKGLDALLPLTAKLIAIEPRFRLLLFGQGPARSRFERKIRQLELGGHVTLCGFEHDLPALLPGLDLFLHPARREGLGVAVLEAMAAGVPVVAAAVGGIVDLVEDGVDGRLVSCAADEAWYDVARELLADPERRHHFAKTAREKIESRFTIEPMIDSYLTLYRDVVDRAGR
jgi:glycosyltransferase involved in cell wall biosynthesis